MLAAVVGSFNLPAFVVRTLPLGRSDAIWSEIGAVGAFEVGIATLGETASPAGSPQPP